MAGLRPTLSKTFTDMGVLKPSWDQKANMETIGTKTATINSAFENFGLFKIDASNLTGTAAFLFFFVVN